VFRLDFLVAIFPCPYESIQAGSNFDYLSFLSEVNCSEILKLCYQSEVTFRLHFSVFQIEYRIAFSTEYSLFQGTESTHSFLDFPVQANLFAALFLK
jgi:hypothetical protein